MNAINTLAEPARERQSVRESRPATRHELKTCLTHRRGAICRSILEALVGNEKYAAKYRVSPGGEDDAALDYFQVVVDCLVLYLDTKDDTYRQIVIGELAKLAHVPDRDIEVLTASRRLAADVVVESILSNCRDSLSPPGLDLLEAELESIGGVVRTPTSRRIDLLFVGDCLFLEVISFLVGPALEAGIELNPTFINSRNPVELQAMIREVAGKDMKWSAVGFSPFTYDFSEHYSRSLRSSSVVARRDAVRDMVEPSMEVIRGHLNLLAAEFDCPIFVHNSANVRRHNGGLADAFKAVASWQTRKRARDEANRRIVAAIGEVNAQTFPHVYVLDEHSLLREHSEWALGARYYDSRDQHPTRLSRGIAARYEDLIATIANLMNRKLVVCDLDNTLWEGEIGEGAVKHYRDRQAILRRLREKGVVLAINSRNDPKNVHWNGALLGEDDFVASEINWDAKSANMKRIQQKLNLKTKDFIFIDDRGDQRELISSSFPEIHVMDAVADRSWRLLDLWSHLVQPSDDGDRTQLYRERERREKFLEEEAAQEAPEAFMAKLGLKAQIRAANRGDLKRVVELINRTNQFNLNASRSTFREAADWIASPNRRILVIDGADKFGQMGLICVAFVEITPEAVRIPVFVLSCRVFGYGFERAMLNAIHRLNRRERGSEGPRSIVGLYQETPLNGPCRSMYPDGGFRQADGHWVHDGNAIPEDPSWLTIADEVSA